MTDGLPYGYRGDWAKVARLIVHRCLRLQSGERVLLWADPTYFPELTEQVRVEIERAGGVFLCNLEFMTPLVDRTRTQLRVREEPARRRAEDEAWAALFDLADVFIWLPNRLTHDYGRTEAILSRWQGRGVHFHWIPGWYPYAADNADLFRKLSARYEEALDIDYDELARVQDGLVKALSGAEVCITTPGGTDLRFDLVDPHFHCNNGDQSKAYVDAHARPGSARDREEELPAGGLRTVDVSNVQGRLVVPDETFPAWSGPQVGALTFDFADDHIVAVHGEHHDDWVQAYWSVQTGDKDRMGELVLGTNPALRPIEGYEHEKVLSYFGFGAGVVRVGVGNNMESGGRHDSSFLHNWLFLTDATLEANGQAIIRDGELLPVR